jgi:hypothetical protein
VKLHALAVLVSERGTVTEVLLPVAAVRTETDRSGTVVTRRDTRRRARYSRAAIDECKAQHHPTTPTTGTKVLKVRTSHAMIGVEDL